MTIAIRFENVSKKFSLERSQPRSWQETLVNLFKKQPSQVKRENFWVLRDINFEVYQGETLGLIGGNGAGKSTLLKLLTYIIKPTRGTIYLQGRISALLELGTGFHPDLTGRENIYLAASLAGLSRAEIEKSTEEIIDFAGIDQFIDIPVRHYSSGMFVRLGFALATHINPDILVVDEVLAVGDASFQKKCLEKIQEIRNRGASVLLVSHSMSVVKWLSDRVMWIKDGSIQSLGSPDEVIAAYLSDQRAVHTQEHQPQKSSTSESKTVEIESVEFINHTGQAASILESGQPATIRINYLAYEQVKNPVFGLAIYRGDGVQVNGPNTSIANFVIESIEGRGAVEYQISFLPLVGGTYTLTVGIFDQTISIAHDYRDRAFNFIVKQKDAREIYGMVYMPAHWRHCEKMMTTYEQSSVT